MFAVYIEWQDKDKKVHTIQGSLIEFPERLRPLHLLSGNSSTQPGNDTISLRLHGIEYCIPAHRLLRMDLNISNPKDDA